jgi:diguanylate cyclase (GGDEF)-like protein
LAGTIVNLEKTGAQAREEITLWADQALGRHKHILRELREVVSALSAATGALCSRDAKYAAELGAFTSRLSAIAADNDVTRLRASLVECTKSLKTCVTRMTEESKESVELLSSQVKEYRGKLEAAERELLTDTLTGLSNRRAFERHMEGRIAAGKPFCLLMMDLDQFKAVNDSFGHVAGDDLLKQFGGELRAQFITGELVSRLGGDEFIAVIGGRLASANEKADRIRKWVFGEYKINTGERIVKTVVKASLGLAEWDGQETATTLLARADREVYKSKRPGMRARRPEGERRFLPEETPEDAEFDHLIR